MRSAYWLSLCLLFGARVAFADADRDAKLYEDARAELRRLEDDEHKRLESWLASNNPFSRQLALLRLKQNPLAVRASTVKLLFAALADREPHPIGDCAIDLVKLRGSLAQGLDQRWHQCQRNQESNSTYAAQVITALGAQRYSDVAALVFVSKIYQTYVGKNARGISLQTASAVRAYFTESLAKLILSDRASAARRNEVGKLDGDPFIDAQDWELDGYTVTFTTQPGAQAGRATVTFTNLGRATTIVLLLVADPIGWRINDILFPETTLRTILR